VSRPVACAYPTAFSVALASKIGNKGGKLTDPKAPAKLVDAHGGEKRVIADNAGRDLYDTVDWEVPVLTGGDVYDRYRIRMLEIRQSLAIIRQLVDRGVPEGPFVVDDPHVALPSKEACYNQMESMIYHFKLIMDGIQVPPGERYDMVEGANGELGFYCVSDGSGHPYRVRVRPPCFPIFSAYPDMIKGHTISDAVIALGGLNVIAGELER
jgi:NADH:ubiquinone oxidoreductase subunit D